VPPGPPVSNAYRHVRGRSRVKLLQSEPLTTLGETTAVAEFCLVLFVPDQQQRLQRNVYNVTGPNVQYKVLTL